jgi:hypothetical protein
MSLLHFSNVGFSNCWLKFAKASCCIPHVKVCLLYSLIWCSLLNFIQAVSPHTLKTDKTIVHAQIMFLLKKNIFQN